MSSVRRGHELEREFGWVVARSLLERPVAALTAPDRDDLLTGPAAPAAPFVDPGTPRRRGRRDRVRRPACAALGRAARRGARAHRSARRRRALGRRALPAAADLFVGRISDAADRDRHRARRPRRGPAGARAPGRDPALRILARAARPRPWARSSAAAAGCRRRLLPACFELTGRHRSRSASCSPRRGSGGRRGRRCLAAATATAAGRWAIGAAAARHDDGRRPGTRLAVAVLEGRPAVARGARSPRSRSTRPTAPGTSSSARTSSGATTRSGPRIRCCARPSMPAAARRARPDVPARGAAPGEAGGQEERVSAHLLQSPADGDPTVVELLRGAARSALGPRGARIGSRLPGSRAARAPARRRGRRCSPSSDAPRPPRAGPPPRSTCAPRWRRRHAARSASRCCSTSAGRCSTRATCPGRPPRSSVGSRRCARARASWRRTSRPATSRRRCTRRSAATEAHRRADLIIAEERHETPAERALLCNAMMLGFFAGRPRSEALAVVRRLYAGGALVDGFHDDPTYAHPGHRRPQLVGRARRGRRGPAAGVRRGATRGSVFRFAMASQVRARQLVRTGPIGDAVEDARTAVDAWRGGQHAYLHAAGHCLVVALLERLRSARPPRLAKLRPARRARSVSAWRHMAVGLVAPRTRSRHEDALDVFLAAGRAPRPPSS